MRIVGTAGATFPTMTPPTDTTAVLQINGSPSSEDLAYQLYFNCNTPPVANADTVNINEDTTFQVSTLLTNDVDAESDTLSVKVTVNPSHGTITGGVYTPTANYFGTDSFSYKANDGTADSVTAATVTINIASANDAPTATGDSFILNEDSPGSFDVRTNDNDVEDASSALVVVKVTDPTHGTIVINNDNTITYTPTANYFGSDSFTYKVPISFVKFFFFFSYFS